MTRKKRGIPRRYWAIRFFRGTKTVKDPGEAADYRPYWQDAWNDSDSRPKWIAKANPDWPGSYRVRYWTDEWKHILFGSENSYLDLIMAAGFDGAFLDVMDAWQMFQ